MLTFFAFSARILSEGENLRNVNTLLVVISFDNDDVKYRKKYEIVGRLNGFLQKD